jgi:polyisoprenoid-binding protein YceI
LDDKACQFTLLFTPPFTHWLRRCRRIKLLNNKVTLDLKQPYLEVNMSWTIDTAHSEVNFTARHMMISNVRGRFEKFSGTVDFDEANPANTKVRVEIDAASIYTREPQRDGHLRSADFFNVEQYPVITFQSKRVELLDERRARLIGDLTIRDVTREIALDVEYSGMSQSPWGTTNAGFTASTQINRKDWGLTWNVALETGGWLVSDEIKIDLDLEIIRQAEAAPA